MHASSACMSPMQIAHSNSSKACIGLALDPRIGLAHALPEPGRCMEGRAIGPRPHASSRASQPLIDQACTAAADSAADMHGKAFSLRAWAETCGSGIGGGNTRARTAARMWPATSCLPRCWWYHLMSGSRGSRAETRAPAAISNSATCKFAASCRGVSTRAPVWEKFGSARASSSNFTTSGDPRAAAAFNGVVAWPKAKTPCELRALTFGDTPCCNNIVTSSDEPWPAATTSWTSSGRLETMPCAWAMVGPEPSAKPRGKGSQAAGPPAQKAMRDALRLPRHDGGAKARPRGEKAGDIALASHPPRGVF
mmetsp:Transcript_16008/g.55633  ORF Transcript_16008/g.55633 Transcript_16008/m.55633 type:complete len:309 (+) Transcript_16008:405-1331(+)